MSAVLTSGCRCVPRFTHKKLAYNLRAEAFYISELRSGYLAYTYVDYCLTSSGVGNTSGVNEWLSVRPALHSQRFVYHFGRTLFIFRNCAPAAPLTRGVRTVCRLRAQIRGAVLTTGCRCVPRFTHKKLAYNLRAKALYQPGCAPATTITRGMRTVCRLRAQIHGAMLTTGCRCVPRFTHKKLAYNLRAKALYFLAALRRPQ